jgi:hypothetical protein
MEACAVADLGTDVGNISLPADFHFDQVLPQPRVSGAPTPAPDLGPLTAFNGDFTGSGFNTIFRPHSVGTPTGLPIDTAPIQGSDNVLELNLTAENLSFSASLGSVPNRGMVQGDIFLNGVPYLQSISDVTTGQAVGIHLEPGLWMSVPSSTDPEEGLTLVRMASIPHGTTICAQGTSQPFVGTPTIPPVSINPSVAFDPTATLPLGSFTFPSQDASNAGTARIPQDLGAFLTAGTITQAMLDDPNSVLRNHNVGLTITGGTVISISTSPVAPVFGGGTDNIAFLLGTPFALIDPKGTGQNAQSIELSATFWIETVEHTIIVPPYLPGQPALPIMPEGPIGQPRPTFLVRPPTPLGEPRSITVNSTQIQYSQVVILNFNGLSWPHVSVATLVPAGSIPVPPSVW